MIIFPDQHGDAMEEMTFAQSQHTEDMSLYETMRKWVGRKITWVRRKLYKLTKH